MTNLSETEQKTLDELTAIICERVPDIKRPQRGARIHHLKNGWKGRIVTDFFNVDMNSCCYVMYDHQAGYTHMETYGVFTLPKGHQHYDVKVDVLGRDITLADVLTSLQNRMEGPIGVSINCDFLDCDEDCNNVVAMEKGKWDPLLPLHLQKPEVHSFLLPFLQKK